MKIIFTLPLLLMVLAGYAQKSLTLTELTGFLNADSTGIKKLLRARQFQVGSTHKVGTDYILPLARAHESIEYEVKYSRLHIDYKNARFSELADFRRQLQQAGYVFKDSDIDGSERPHTRMDKMSTYFLYRAELIVDSPDYFLVTLERFPENGGPPPIFTKGDPGVTELNYFLDCDTAMLGKAMRLKRYVNSGGSGTDDYETGFNRLKKGSYDQLAYLMRMHEYDGKRVQFTSYVMGDVERYKKQILAAKFILHDSVTDRYSRLIYTYQKEENEVSTKVIKFTLEPGHSFTLEIFRKLDELKDGGLGM